MLAPPPVAARSFSIYVLLALVVGAGLPFIRFPAFSFRLLEPPAAVPIFLANGELAVPSEFEEFAGIAGGDVDVEHAGFSSPVSHRFHENRRWIHDHRYIPEVLG